MSESASERPSLRLVEERVSVHSVFRTIQGEGAFAGASAVFVRFSGCNAWNGRESGRAKGAGVCSRFCDTEFSGHDEKNFGGMLTPADLTLAVLKLSEPTPPDLVVFTGGEPSLQLTKKLVAAVRLSLGDKARMHMETNGTTRVDGLDWITLSPKPGLPIDANYIFDPPDELKYLWPLTVCYQSDNQEINEMLANISVRYIQAIDLDGDGKPPCLEDLVRFITNGRGYRLSLQIHKLLGLS